MVRLGELLNKRIYLMDDLVRCPACLGAKKVPKLGGIVGDCNTCLGIGTIRAVEKVAPKVIELEVVSNADIINAVSQAVPVQVEKPVEQVKIDPKKALYKRKQI